MRFPAPKPGLVIRYGFLWSHEADAGSDESAKDRPCAIVIAATVADRSIRTLVAPITHRPPDDPLDSIELPRTVAHALGLDGERHWLRLDELNRFTWPGFDLRTIPGPTGGYAYGMLPEELFEQLRAGIVARQKAKAGRVQGRE